MATYHCAHTPGDRVLVYNAAPDRLVFEVHGDENAVTLNPHNARALAEQLIAFADARARERALSEEPEPEPEPSVEPEPEPARSDVWQVHYHAMFLTGLQRGMNPRDAARLARITANNLEYC